MRLPLRFTPATGLRSAIALCAWCVAAPVGALSLVGCGAPPPPPPKVAPPPKEEEPKPIAEPDADIGALDRDEIDEAFRSVKGSSKNCLFEAAMRNPMIEGEVKFYVEIDYTGKLVHAHVEESSVGDILLERCFLNRLHSRVSWPKPQGGRLGKARHIYKAAKAESAGDYNTWGPERVKDALAKARADIDACKAGVAGTFTATIYLEADGTVLSAGVAVDDKEGAGATECIAKVLKATKFKGPGDNPVKVSVQL